LAGVLLHRPQRVLRVLSALIFIEASEDLANQVAGGVVAKFLSDRKQFDPGFPQTADIHF
jgi:hypothetical protein